MLIIFLLILAVVAISFALHSINKKSINKKSINKSRQKLWIYWENVPGKRRPAYIDLCIKSVYKHCSKSFDIIQLNEKNIHDYLPELKEKILDFSKLSIPQKVDYYRILLLYKYGGVYMDSDILVLRDPVEITYHLNEYDFVGFGCTGKTCKNGYGRPSNWILCSRANTMLMRNILTNYENKLNNLKNNDDYHAFGKALIWSELDKLLQSGYSYYHYPNLYDGTRDKDGQWVTMKRLFSNEKIEYDHPDDLMFIVMYNTGNDLDDKLRYMSENELLTTNLNIGEYIRHSLK